MNDRSRVVPVIEQLALAMCCAFAFCCSAFFVYQAIPWLAFPADLAMWGESAFVGDIIKLETGVPLYTPPEWSNSMIYTPGAPWLTWLILKLPILDMSVPTMRWVQIGFAAVAGAVAAWSTFLLRRFLPDSGPRNGLWWSSLTVLLTFLAATAPEVNRNVTVLHNDALALLTSVVFWVCLVRYVQSPQWQRLVPLVLLPAIGWSVKQFLIAWLPMTAIVLALLPAESVRQRGKRVGLYVVLSAAVYMAVVAAFRAAYGEPFTFWVFEVMGGVRTRITLAGEFNIALVRSIDHLFRAWWQLLLGVIGGWLLMRRVLDPRLAALFAGWVSLIGAEVLISGAGWSTLYHFGPGVLMGVTMLLAALPHTFTAQPNEGAFLPRTVLANGALVSVVVAICVALRVIPTRDASAARWFPGVRPTAALQTHVSAIEGEFAGLPASAVLLDVGNWIYLQDGVLQRDRAISLADQAPADIYENFEPFLKRIRNQEYRKILVHDLHDTKFVYDHHRWRRSSGVRQALATYYEEVRTIPGVESTRLMFSGPVSVLIPRVIP